MLEERELTWLAERTQVDADAIARVITAAAEAHIVLVLPAFHVAGEFAGWDAFAAPGPAKAAHLAEVGAFRALCSAPRASSSVTPDPRTRVCIGCESQVRALQTKPSAVRAYQRGEAPRPLGESPLPPALGRAKAAAPQEDRPAGRVPRAKGAPAPRPAPAARPAAVPAAPPSEMPSLF